MSDVVQDIQQRLTSLDERFTEDKIKDLITSVLGGMDEKDPVLRKFQFATPEPKLAGTKFARYGLEVADIEMVYDIVTSAQRVGLSSGPSEALEKAFKELSEAHYMSEEEIKAIDKRALDNVYPRLPKMGFRGAARQQAAAAAQRAMDTAESGFGSQLVGAQYVRDMWEGARPESRVFGLLDSFEMMDPTVYIPVEVDIPEMIYVGENTANNSAAYATVKTGTNRVQVDAKKFVIHQMWSGELEEDSIIAFVAYLRRQAQLSIAHYSDSLVVNGDATIAATGNINSDDAAPAATKHYLAFDGIRHAALVDNAANAVDAAGALALTDIADLRALMIDKTRLMDFGHPTNPEDLVMIADPQTADQIALLDEIMQIRINQPAGALLNGEVARLLGHPIISSMAVPLTEADGKVSAVTPANNVFGQLLMFNRRGYKVGWRRRVKVETERLPATDQNRIVYSLRMGFGRFTPTGAASGIETAAAAYNVTV